MGKGIELKKKQVQKIQGAMSQDENNKTKAIKKSKASQDLVVISNIQNIQKHLDTFEDLSETDLSIDMEAQSESESDVPQQPLITQSKQPQQPIMPQSNQPQQPLIMQFDQNLKFEYMSDLIDNSKAYEQITSKFDSVRLNMICKYDKFYSGNDYYKNHHQGNELLFNTACTQLSTTKLLETNINDADMIISQQFNKLNTGKILDQCVVDFFVFKQGETKFSINFRFYPRSCQLWMAKADSHKFKVKGNTFKCDNLMNKLQTFLNQFKILNEFDSVMNEENDIMMKPSFMYGLLNGAIRMNHTYKI